VVVDSFSTDRTEAIVREHGAMPGGRQARFVQHAFAGHIDQKNWAVTQAKHPWILSLDADEALDEKLLRSILKAKGGADGADGFTMNRLTNYCGTWIRHGGWYPDVKLRLWDSRKGRWGGIDPHDRYEMDSGARITHLGGDILHYSFNSIADHIKQADHFTTIAAKAYAERGKNASVIKLMLGPVVKFIGDYIFRLGFLDGYHGFVIARISAHAAFSKYAKLRQLRRTRA